MTEDFDRKALTTRRKEQQKRSSEHRAAKRRQYSAEEKVRIVVAGLRGEERIVALCRNEGINQNLYYRWHNEFLEAGTQRLAGNTSRDAPNREIRELRAEAEQLKRLLGELLLENSMLKKKAGSGSDQDPTKRGR